MSEHKSRNVTYNQAKRRKYTFNDSAKSGFCLETGLKGFLCTFNNREKECIRESYNILNKYADQLYGDETEKVSVQEASGNVEDDLKKELKELKAENLNLKKKRFQVVKSGAKNVLFIRTSVDDPVGLVSVIAQEIKDTKQSQTRFLIRLIPVEITCKAYIDDIKKNVGGLLEKHFKNNKKSFSIVYNRRNNSHLDRDEVIKEIADLVMQIPGENSVNLTQPDISIIIEIIRGVAFLAVIPNYIQMKKFNLHAFIDGDVKEQDNVKDDGE